MKKLFTLLFILCSVGNFVASAQVVDSDQTVTVPVVVHIVYSTIIPKYTVTMDQVNSQIDALNKDFTTENIDYSKLAIFDSQNGTNFLSVAAGPPNSPNGVGINFELAKRDPNGLGTTGVVYYGKNGIEPTFSTNNANLPLGLPAPWDVTRYLNIYVVPKVMVNGTSVRGASDYTSCVVRYNCFGTLDAGANVPTDFVLDPKFKEGGITTHEVGHCFNLLEIFGNDGIGDTPSQNIANHDCNGVGVVNMQNNHYTMSMNYMDYPDDPCVYMFTMGQRVVMRNAVFANNAILIDPGQNNALLPPLCTHVNEASITYSKSNFASFSPLMTVNWTGNGALGYKVKVYYKNEFEKRWVFDQELNPATATTSFSVYWETKYRVEIYTKCSDGGYSMMAVKDNMMAPDATENNSLFGTAEPVAGLYTASGLQNGINKYAALCMLNCATPDSDIFVFSTMSIFNDNISYPVNVVINIPSGQLVPSTADIFLYRQECTYIIPGGMSAPHISCESDAPTLVASRAGASVLSITYRPCGGLRYKYYLVVKKDPAFPGYGGIYSAALPYLLNVRLMADFSPICSFIPPSDPTVTDLESEINPIQDLTENSDNFAIFPNPSNGIYNLRSEKGIHMVTVTDLAGRVISVNEPGIDVYAYEIDITGYPAGIYIVTVNGSFGEENKKIIKN